MPDVDSNLYVEVKFIRHDNEVLWGETRASFPLVRSHRDSTGSG